MSPGPARFPSFSWTALLLPLLSFCAVLPLVLHGPSCGHDFDFHLQSWIDASSQIRHGHLVPHWAFSPAYNAGEPRFTFYPPLSWLLGAVLLLLLPANATPVAFTWLALTGAAVAMYALARRFTSENGALLASAVYIGNPYVLFTAFERTAFGELLAAAWLPLLLRATLAGDISALSLAVPLALLWLSNAPAAVMGTYAVVLIVLFRVVLEVWRGRESSFGLIATALRPLLMQAAGGLVLGAGLAAFYLVPVAWERRYVQIAMAIIPNMRVEDNFLFGHTGDAPHDNVLHTASVISLLLLGLTALVFLVCLWRRTHAVGEATASSRSLLEPTTSVLIVLLALTVILAAMLTPVTLPVWHLLPELAFLQFPWRLLAVLGCVFGAATALALRQVRVPFWLATIVGLATVSAASFVAARQLRQGCDANELPRDRVALFATHHGTAPTDEYTPTTADNDQLRWDDPAWWLAPDPNAPGPKTVPNPAAVILNYDQPPPLDQTVSGQAPVALRLELDEPQDLVLNLRDYPAWRVTVNGTLPAHLQRDDGLIAIALPAGISLVDVHWQRLPDVWLGDALSVCALAFAGWLRLRSRRIEV